MGKGVLFLQLQPISFPLLLFYTQRRKIEGKQASKTTTKPQPAKHQKNLAEPNQIRAAKVTKGTTLIRYGEPGSKKENRSWK